MVNKYEPVDSVKLEAMGDVTSDGLNCRNLKLVDSLIDKVRVSYNSTEEVITGIRYFKGLRFVNFGEMDGDY